MNIENDSTSVTHPTYTRNIPVLPTTTLGSARNTTSDQSPRGPSPLIRRDTIGPCILIRHQQVGIGATYMHIGEGEE